MAICYRQTLLPNFFTSSRLNLSPPFILNNATTEHFLRHPFHSNPLERCLGAKVKGW